MGRAARTKARRRAATPPHAARAAAVAEMPAQALPPRPPAAHRTDYFADAAEIPLLPLNAPADTDRANCVAGKYRLDRRLGGGANKDVFAATDARTGERVCLAVFRQLDDDRLDLAARALRLRALPRHRNLATVYDYGVDITESHTLVYLVLELVEGPSLRDAVLRQGQPLNLAGLLRATDDVMAGLEHLHAHSLIHGSPHARNLLLSDRLVLTDYDWTRAPGETAPISDDVIDLHTERWRTSIDYVTPEWYLGKPADTRSDLYISGLALYEAATETMPFFHAADDLDGAFSYTLIERKLRTLPIPPSYHNPNLPKRLDALLLALLTPDPAARIQSASEVRAELHAIARHERIPLVADLSPASHAAKG